VSFFREKHPSKSSFNHDTTTIVYVYNDHCMGMQVFLRCAKGTPLEKIRKTKGNRNQCKKNPLIKNILLLLMYQKLTAAPKRWVKL
jgi:hypothetical protein